MGWARIVGARLGKGVGDGWEEVSVGGGRSPFEPGANERMAVDAV